MVARQARRPVPTDRLGFKFLPLLAAPAADHSIIIPGTARLPSPSHGRRGRRRQTPSHRAAQLAHRRLPDGRPGLRPKFSAGRLGRAAVAVASRQQSGLGLGLR